jgi:acyl carrier protein
MGTTVHAPYADENPWRLDTFMNAEEWKEVSRWYPFSLRSLMPDGRWFEQARCKSGNSAYSIMKALAATRPRDYFVIVQCTLRGKAGREKAVVCFPGSETSLLQERQRRIKPGKATAPAAQRTTKAPTKEPLKDAALEEKLKGCILRAIDCDKKDIVYSASLVEDLGMDVADLIEFTICLEEEFHIPFREIEIERLSTFGEALEYVHEKGTI